MREILPPWLFFVVVWLFLFLFILSKGILSLKRVRVTRVDQHRELDLFPRSTLLVDPFTVGQSGFEYAGTYEVAARRTFHYLLWRHRSGDHSIGVAFMGPRALSVDFATGYAGGLTIVTTNLPSAHAFPRAPEEFVQVFSKAPAIELWAHHADADAMLLAAGLACGLRDTRDVETQLEESLRRHGDYVRSIAFWFLRLPFWTMFRPRRWNNLTLAQQLERGMIRLPERAAP